MKILVTPRVLRGFLIAPLLLLALAAQGDLPQNIKDQHRRVAVIRKDLDSARARYEAAVAIASKFKREIEDLEIEDKAATAKLRLLILRYAEDAVKPIDPVKEDQ